jgi:hypothetical protein
MPYGLFCWERGSPWSTASNGSRYAGAIWFYELVRKGHSYASATVTFSGAPVFSQTTAIAITLAGATTTLEHLNLIGDTAQSIAKAFELIINNGFTGIRASASDGRCMSLPTAASPRRFIRTRRSFCPG